MSLNIFFLVLLAAFFHAVWNIIVKGGNNKLYETTLNSLGGGLGALFLLPFAGMPRMDCWWSLGLSVCFHLLYSLSMADTYRVADLTITYPVMRGTAPILTAILLSIFGIPLSCNGWLGIILLCSGIFAISFQRRATGNLEGIYKALRTSMTICAYTLADGFGAREAGDSLSYTVWLFIINIFPLNFYCLFRQMNSFIGYAKKRAIIGIIGGVCGLTSYGIAIWAMSKASIALVAGLRETSVIFGVILAVIFLNEKLSIYKVCAILLVTAGAILVRLN